MVYHFTQSLLILPCSCGDFCCCATACVAVYLGQWCLSINGDSDTVDSAQGATITHCSDIATANCVGAGVRHMLLNVQQTVWLLCCDALDDLAWNPGGQPDRLLDSIMGHVNIMMLLPPAVQYTIPYCMLYSLASCIPWYV